MRDAIDVCFCDHEWRVLHVVPRMRPRRVTRWVGRARYAVEARPGSFDAVRAGAQLSLVERSERYAPS